MRFDPKLIHPDEPPLTDVGELDLSADLAALAEQLGEDAARLAAAYPAALYPAALAEPVAPVAAPRAPRPWSSYRIALSGAAVAGLVLAALVWRSPWIATRQEHAAAVNPPAVRAAPVAVGAPAPATAAKMTAPGLSLADLSGPELEALLDLQKHDPERVTSISF